MQDAYLVDAIRSPIGKFRGGLSDVRADDLAAFVLKALLSRNPQVPPDHIDDVILGCHNQAGEDNRNVARMALLLAGMPVTVPGETVNRLCASGMSAVIHGNRAIKAGDGNLFIAGGVEHMTRSPLVLSKPSQPYGNDAQLYDSSFGWRFVNPRMKTLYGTEAMGETAENLVDLQTISREDQDRFAYRSQQKATRARDTGRLAQEIVPIEIPQRKGEPLFFREDEFIRPDTTLEALATLKPAFRREGGTVTAGNASGLNDGAAMLLIASETAVKTFALQPLARIVASQVVGLEPRLMGLGPVEASRKVLQKARLTFSDLGVIELNEAFAAQCLACLRSWGLDDDDPRVNPNGGALALGHPLGMSGARLLQTAALELQARKQRYALCTLCVGVGQGYATLLENINL
ncbi:3-oxoadipyl-CoA thiolase [Catalinimonas alkaloidigena]|uniref:acetyl-CoA C-acyltransferase n=1 Tax=Catalinimonas alkaloidigena TaxID=1075417 RepID=A0A1G9K5M8_9BACT|nr:3-oxoadipyl-CoA thiolase [Catalinimonas alkaloidigena]SDL44665.1 3-oxoadipyl-CoA thiolase [Catalinimonas alkaloidigena]